jgi:hypothetical protein
MNLTLPINLQYVMDNPALHQDTCRYAFDQFVYFTKGLGLLQDLLILILIATVAMYLILVWKFRVLECKMNMLLERDKKEKEGVEDADRGDGSVGVSSSLK